jgi:putative ABC transport system substrate-binding protein
VIRSTPHHSGAVLMRRRDFIALAGAAATFPRVGLAQTRLPRVAYLSITEVPQRPQAFRDGLSERGYVDGKTITLELFTAPTVADLPAFAARVVASKPDVIFAVTTAASQDLRDATATIPIVFTIVTDPVGSGLVASLARPGGNITGNSLVSRDLIGKQISILKELVPSLTRMAVLNVPADPVAPLYVEPIRSASAAAGVEPIVLDFVDDGPAGLERQFARVIDARVGAILLQRYAYMTVSNNRDIVFDLLIKNKLLAVSSDVVDGATTPFVGTVCYGANTVGSIRRATSLVDAILKGAKPGDVPVEQPTAFDFAVNLETARKIGFALPASILAQATLVVDEDWRAPKSGK